MELQEFRSEVLKVKESRHHKVTNSYGSKQMWRWLRKKKWLDLGQPITERQMGYIIKAINESLKDQLLEGKDIVLPHRMGRIELRKFKVRVEIRDGKIVTNLPIDWEKTIRLWHEDEESHKAKTLVRMEAKEGYKIRYDKNEANYENKSFYQFIPNTELKRELRDKILNGEVDAFLLERHAVH